MVMHELGMTCRPFPSLFRVQCTCPARRVADGVGTSSSASENETPHNFDNASARTHRNISTEEWDTTVRGGSFGLSPSFAFALSAS